MKNMNYFRHGDISLHPEKKAKGKIVKHDGSFIVEHGESGHKHTITVKQKEDLIIRKDVSGNYYFELLKEGELTHEEHKRLIIPPGIYKKNKEREVDHFSGATRSVVD